jgi:iron complex transport system substrate-binding protein
MRLSPEIQDRPVCTEARLNSSAPCAEIHNEVNNILQSALSIYQIKTDVLEKLQPTHILPKTSVMFVQLAFKMLRKPLLPLPTANRRLFLCSRIFCLMFGLILIELPVR